MAYVAIFLVSNGFYKYPNGWIQSNNSHNRSFISMPRLNSGMANIAIRHNFYPR